jgi:hypothetical protein
VVVGFDPRGFYLRVRGRRGAPLVGSIVDGFATYLVVGVKQGLGQEVPDVGAAKPVDDPAAFSPALDEAGEPEFGEVLAGDSWATAGDLGERSHVGVFTPYRPEESYPGGVGQKGEGHGRGADPGVVENIRVRGGCGA